MDTLRERLDSAESGQTRGYCHCCRQGTSFETSDAWLRDHYVCTRCHSVPRQRHIQYVLDRYFRGWERRALHESSPSHDYIARFSTAYSESQFFPDAPLGSYVAGVRCEDLERLTFDDETFDIVITQDVFEHITEPAEAAREIHRVLKPGGVHLLTVPRRFEIAESRRRTTAVAGKQEPLFRPEYHGSPVGDGRALVTWDYGRDFEELLAEWSGGTVATVLTRDRSLGLDGELLDVFINRKGSRGTT